MLHIVQRTVQHIVNNLNSVRSSQRHVASIHSLCMRMPQGGSAVKLVSALSRYRRSCKIFLTNVCRFYVDLTPFRHAQLCHLFYAYS